MEGKSGKEVNEWMAIEMQLLMECSHKSELKIDSPGPDTVTIRGHSQMKCL